MPVKVASVAGGTAYAQPMIGPMGPLEHVKIDLSTLTSAEVDAQGYLKPGVVFKLAGGLGVLVTAGTDSIYGVCPEATKLSVVTPTTTTTLAAETGDHFVGLCMSGLINRDVAEDNMGRAYSANEIAAFLVAPCQLRLGQT
jgi:hypothetical protein